MHAQLMEAINNLIFVYKNVILKQQIVFSTAKANIKPYQPYKLRN
jgi:hypothetical protein